MSKPTVTWNHSNWSQPMVPTRNHGPPSVINVSFMRMATMSMARAYDTLGLRAHHGLDLQDHPDCHQQWALLERAAEATWADVLPSAHATGARRFTRADWDALFGEYDAVTDLAAVFAHQLVEAYPNAKVVVVQRDFDSWWASFEPHVVKAVFDPVGMVVTTAIAYLTGHRAVPASSKSLTGLFRGATTVEEFQARARTVYDDYYARIRETVPPERRLEYKVGDGWEPLCAFLGKEVPDVPFPRVNDKAEHDARVDRQMKIFARETWAVLRPWVLGLGTAGVVGVAVWLARKR